MRVILAAHQNWGVDCLQTLFNDPSHEIAGVLTYPCNFDLQSGPYYEVYYKSVREKALSLGLDVYQPEDVNSREAKTWLKQHQPEVIMNVAYGQIYKEETLKIPPKGVVNLHGSLLPRHRGVTPIASALISGDTAVGVTAHFITRGIDEGPIIAQHSVALSPLDHAGDVFNKTWDIYPTLMLESLARIESGNMTLTPQLESDATYFPRRERIIERIDWTNPASVISNQIRALSYPFRGAYAVMGSKEIIIWRSGGYEPNETNAVPGAIIGMHYDCLAIATGKGTVWVHEIEVEKGVRISAERLLTFTPIGSIFDSVY